MPTKTVRVESDCIDIIRSYCPDGSITDGIRLMDRKVRDREMTSVELPAASATWYPVAPEMSDGVPKEYWVRFNRDMKKIVDDLVERAQRGY